MKRLQRTSTTLLELIEAGHWDLLRIRIMENKEEIKKTDEITGRTILHQLAYKPPVPDDIFQLVVETYPEAAKVQEKLYGTTPLHILCWTSQRSTRKVQILLKHMEPADLLRRSYFGGTALHSACGSNANIDVIKAIVKPNPSIVLAKTHGKSILYKQTALIALWQCHLQTIPGHMQIARILQGEDVRERHFERVWEKIIFLACEAFKVSPSYQKGEIEESEIENYALHGLLSLKAPVALYKVAIKRHPKWTAYPDGNGNYPLHNILTTRPYRVKDVEIITELLKAFPEVASKKNKKGESPIFVAIRERLGWEEGLGQIVNAKPEILASTDDETGLFPFLFAATLGGRVAIESTFHLLSSKPDLI